MGTGIIASVFPIAPLLTDFGVTGGSGSIGPEAPIISAVDNQDGTVTVTISGTTGAEHLVYAQHVSETLWTLEGTRAGDGSVIIDLDNFGRYFIYVSSTLNSQSASSSVLTIVIVNANDLQGLEHTPAEIIQQLLIDRLEATDPEGTSEWPVFVSVLPAEPENALTCNDTQGRTHGRIQTSGKVPKHRGVMILLRSANPNTGYVKLEGISVLLTQDVVRNTVVVDASTYLIQSISQVGGIHSLGRESTLSDNRGSVSDCQLYSLNLLVSVKQVA